MEDKDIIISKLRDELAGLKKQVTEIERGPTEPKKQMEERLKESEERYRTLVDTSIDMIFTVDMKGNFLVTNPAFERILACDGITINADMLHGFMFCMAWAIPSALVSVGTACM